MLCHGSLHPHLAAALSAQEPQMLVVTRSELPVRIFGDYNLSQLCVEWKAHTYAIAYD